MYVSFGKRVCDIVVGLVALPFVLLIIAVLAPFIHFEDIDDIAFCDFTGKDVVRHSLVAAIVSAYDQASRKA